MRAVEVHAKDRQNPSRPFMLRQACPERRRRAQHERKRVSGHSSCFSKCQSNQTWMKNGRFVSASARFAFGVGWCFLFSAGNGGVAACPPQPTEEPDENRRADDQQAGVLEHAQHDDAHHQHHQNREGPAIVMGRRRPGAANAGFLFCHVNGCSPCRLYNRGWRREKLVDSRSPAFSREGWVVVVCFIHP